VKTAKANLFMLHYVFRFTPVYAIFSLLLAVFGAATEILTGTLLVKAVVDLIQISGSFSEVVRYIALTSAFALVYYAVNSWFQKKYSLKAKEILHDKMQTELFEHAVAMDLQYYDNSKFYNDFVWASQEADTRAVAVLESISDLLYNLVTFLCLSLFAILWEPFVLLFIALSFAITFFIGQKKNKTRFAYQTELKPKERKRDYIQRVFYLPDYAKELRLSKIPAIMLEKLDENCEDLKATTKKFGFRMWFWDGMRNILGNVCMMDVGAVLFLCFKALVVKTLSYGSFVVLINAIWDIKWALQDIISLSSQVAENQLYIDRFRTFLESRSHLAETENAVPIPEKDAVLQLNNVSFTYEGSSEPTLSHINLTLHPHEKIAIVGYNGAGKSTLVKLMLRLYDVGSGSITLAGQDIRNYSLSAYREQIGVVFQDFQLYAATLGENIKMDCVLPQDCDTLERCAKDAGLGEKLSHLSLGLETPLTKEFEENGVNLSGGEAQKIAIARTLFRGDVPFAIMDEPSSALDPVSEYNLNKLIMQVGERKSVILISHRLSSTRMADRIYVLDHGSIAEVGSHDELMRNNGLYAKMFQMQASEYRKNA